MRADGLSQGGKSCFCGNAPAITAAMKAPIAVVISTMTFVSLQPGGTKDYPL